MGTPSVKCYRIFLAALMRTATPAVEVAVTLTRMCPAALSAATSLYVLLVAPAISVHVPGAVDAAAPVAVQRYHWYL